MSFQKYYIYTYGCQANIADSERIATKLENAGYKKTKSLNKADIIILNACSVRQSAINRLYSRIKNIKEKHKDVKLIVSGCLLPEDRKKIEKLVGEIWHPDDYFDLLPIRSNPKIAYVPIMKGCNNFCSYCAVPFTRGREKSRKEKDIIEEIKSLIDPKNGGYKEIWLLGQNVNSYKPSFPKLLKKINNLPGDFEIHFLTSHPKDMSDELINTIAECKKVSKEIHLPIQSGDNKILKMMNRGYTVEYYKKLIKKIRRKIKGVKISTDIIVGFPGETKKQFENTIKLCKEIGFSKAYIAKYSPRPGTLASRLKDNISDKEKKRRWKILDDIINKK